MSVTTERNEAATIDADAIPQAMRERNQWVLWRNFVRNDRPTKVPYQTNGTTAETDDSKTWTTFDDVWRRYQKGGFAGIGFVFAEDDPFCGIDLDGCRDPQTGAIADWAQTIMDTFATYAEVSPSESGIKLFVRGKWPLGGKKKQLKEIEGAGGKAAGLEVYDQKRYFAVTGWRVDGSPVELAERQQQLESLAREHWPQSFRQRKPSQQQSNGHGGHGDVIDRARRYIATMPAAISGQGGHNATFAVACKLCIGFALPRETALPLLREWSDANADPPWSDRELEHKIDSAMNAEGERGHLLNAERNGHAGQAEKGTANSPDVSEHRARDGAASGGTAKPTRKLTDLGNAERFIEQHKGDVFYVPQWKGWNEWDGTRFRRDDTCAVERRAQQTVKSIFTEASQVDDADIAKAVVGWALKSQHAQRIPAMLTLARSQMVVTPDKLDADPWLLNCQNGTIDLHTGAIREHRREDLLTKCCPVEYPAANEAECPLWLDHLHRIFDGHQHMVDFMQRLCGYALVGTVQEHILPIWWGNGGNGKGVTYGTLLEMLGPDYGLKAPQGLLMYGAHKAHPTERADLFGKRLVVCSETEEGHRFAEALVKELTGGDRIRARRLYEDHWEFPPSHLAILVTNHMPTVKGNDDGIWRRLRLVPFVVTIPKAEQQGDLPERLRSELGAILRWCVDGCLAWQRDGLCEPDEVLAATSSYRAEMDVLTAFIGECCITGSAFKVRASALYAKYVEWCQRSGEQADTMTAFGRALSERGYTKRMNNGTWYVGIAVSATCD